MTDQELYYVKTVIEEKNISKAAQKLFISQPSLSQYVKRVESTLGTKLFKRTNSGLCLTIAGEKFYKVANEILRIYNDFELEISDINNLKKGKIIIGTTTYLAMMIMPEILPIFKKACPNIEVCVIEENSTNLERILISGKLDFAIIHTSPYREILKNPKINFLPLKEDPFMLVTKKDHPLSKYQKRSNEKPYAQIDIKQFENEPFIAVSHGKKIRQVSELIFHKANISPEVIFTTSSYETARRLACVGVGFTFVPKLYAEIFTGSYKPDYFYIDEKYLPYWTLGIAVNKNSYISKASKYFIKIVSEKFGFNTIGF